MFVSKKSEPQLRIIMGLRWYTLHGLIAGIEAFVKPRPPSAHLMGLRVVLDRCALGAAEWYSV